MRQQAPGVVLQSFIDSDSGGIFVDILHTFGAIAYLAGVALYGVWLRGLRRGQADGRLLSTSMMITYVAIAANLLGGFGRTYQTGHPSIREIQTEPWVQVMLAKHVVLFFGMGIAIWLFEGLAPRLVRSLKAGNRRDPVRATHRTAVRVIVASILAATVLGAVSQIMDLGSDDMDDDPLPSEGRTYTFSGSLTSTAAAPRTQSGTFDVPAGIDSMTATLTWTPAQFDLSVLLTDPNGDHVEARPSAEIQGPAPGQWRYVVRSDLAVDASWELTIVVGDGAPNLLANTILLNPGVFYEINTMMDNNATIYFQWTIVEDAEVDFNLHTHFDDEVDYPIRYTAASGAGNYTAQREGGHSLMWENPGGTPLRLQYRVWGDYELDSIFP